MDVPGVGLHVVCIFYKIKYALQVCLLLEKICFTLVWRDLSGHFINTTAKLSIFPISRSSQCHVKVTGHVRGLNTKANLGYMYPCELSQLGSRAVL